MTKRRKADAPITGAERPWSIAPELAKTAAIGVCTALVGAAGVWLTPVRGMIMDLLWDESVRLEVLATTSQLYEGDEFDLHVLAHPQSPLSVSSGVLRVVPAGPGARVIKADQVVPFAAFDTPTLLTKSTPFKILADAPGSTTLHVLMQTNRRSYPHDLPIVVLPRAPSGHPSPNNYTGTWKLTVGPYTGSMEIVEKKKTFGGRWELYGGPRGSKQRLFGAVEGSRDSGPVHVSFFIDNTTRKWVLEKATAEMKGDDLVIEAIAVSYKVTGDDWVRYGEERRFHAIGGQ